MTLDLHSFPATDRPTDAFLAQVERALRKLRPDSIGLGTALSLSVFGAAEEGVVERELGAAACRVTVSAGGVMGWLAIPDATLDLLVDLAFGGDGRNPGLPAPTPVGLRLGNRIAAMLAEALGTVLPGLVRRPYDGDGARDPATPVVACGFDVSTRGRSLGTIALCLPLAALAEFEQLAARAMGEADWSDRLGAACGGIRLPMRAVLARPVLTAGEIAGLSPGVVIPIGSIAEVALIAGGFRVATGTAEARDGRACLVITRTEFEA